MRRERLTIKIHVAGHLKDYTGESVDLVIDRASDILDVISQLDERVPGIKDRILDEHDKTRTYINIYVNEESIRYLGDESTKANDGDVIYILPSVAGGKSGLTGDGEGEGANR
jgi:molybdopterin converting factor small subunit